MRFRRPRPALIIAGILLFVLAAGAAYAASANPDKASTAGAARGSAASAPSPKDFFHTAAIGMPPTCDAIATPPEGKALIVRQVRIDTYANPTPGLGNNVLLFVGVGGCDQIVSDINPASIGLDTVTFDPGLSIPAGSKLFGYQQGGVEAEAYIDAYLVKANQVPPSTIVSPKSIPQQH